MDLKEYNIFELESLKIMNYTEGLNYDTTKIDNKTLETIIQKIMKKQNYAFSIPIYVSVREDGSKYIIDGKHRVKAILNLINYNIIKYNEFSIPVLEWENISIDEETQLYLNTHKYTGKLTKSDFVKLDLNSRELNGNEYKAKLALDNFNKNSFDVEYSSKYTIVLNFIENRHTIEGWEIPRLFHNCYLALVDKYKNEYISSETVFKGKTSFILIYYIAYILYDDNMTYLDNLTNITRVIQHTTVKGSVVKVHDNTLSLNTIKDIAWLITQKQSVIEF